MTLFRKLFPILIAASPLLQASAQTTVFAELQGSPVINTTGWNLTGIAGPGDTNGDANTDNDELVLTPPQGDMSGAVFFAQPKGKYFLEIALEKKIKQFLAFEIKETHCND